VTGNKSFIITSIFIGIILQIIPMPPPIDLYRPDWLLLILLYWAMALPNRVSVGIAGLAGVVLDLLYGTALGIHSFALAVSVYLVSANYQRLRNYSMIQQAMMILVLCVLYHLTSYWLQYLITGIEFSWIFLWPAISSTIIWPWLFWLLRKFRRNLGVT
jgi:rod shape-determining protein MreD